MNPLRALGEHEAGQLSLARRYLIDGGPLAIERALEIVEELTGDRLPAKEQAPPPA